MGNLQFYSKSSTIFDNPWIDLVEMPRDAFENDKIHPLHNNAKVFAFNKNVLLIIADCNVLLFNTNHQKYQHITKIPEYKYNTDHPPTIKAINVSSYYNDNKYYFIIFQSNSDSSHSNMTMYKLIINMNDNQNMNNIKCKWIDIKSKFMKYDKCIDLKCSKLLRDKYNNNNSLIFLFYIQIWPTRMIAIFDIKQYKMSIKRIDDNKWFSISSMMNINKNQFLSFNNIGPEIIHYSFNKNNKINQYMITQKQIEFPVEFLLYFSTTNIKYSNYIIRFGSYSDCSSLGIISIYDYINNKWYESDIKSYADRLIQSVAIQNGYIHCFGRNKSKNGELRFNDSLLYHYKINIELLLFDLELLYWDNSKTSRIVYVIYHWLRMRRIPYNDWNNNLSIVIMNYLCVKD